MITMKTLTGCIAYVKNVMHNIAGIFVAGGVILAMTLPDISPYDTASYTAVKVGNQMLIRIDIPKRTSYPADIVLYAGSGFIGTIPVPSGGQRDIEASFDLPPSVANRTALTITAYWKIHSWQEFLIPQEIYHQVSVTSPGG